MSSAAALFPALDTPPARTALTFPERSLSYIELARATAAVAARVADRERVAVLAESCPETCVAVIGALRVGVPVVPVNPRSGERELAHIVSDAEPQALILRPSADVPGALSSCPVVTVDLDQAGSASQPPPEPVDTEAPALIIYTSGTTGPPKGAVLPRRALASNLDALADVWNWTAADAVTHGLPLFHVHGLVVGILGPVRRGGSAFHVGRFTPAAIGAALNEGASMVFGVPTMYRRLAEAAEGAPELAAALAGARLLISGSAALPVAEHERLARLAGRPVLERYGMTETLMITAIRADAEPRPGTVGEPLPGVEARLVDDAGAPIEGSDPETMGEIEVRGPNLFLGYLGQPQATAEAFHDGWFRTGDMATRDARGYIRIVGRRATDLIKSGGYKIGAGEIEAALREHPAVEDAAVTGEPDDELGERVVAWVILRAGQDSRAEELINHVAAQLAPHKRPRRVLFLDALPRNELGKVQKQRLSGG